MHSSPSSTLNNLAFASYTAGPLAAASGIIYRMHADEPDPRVTSTMISAGFLFATIGGTIQAWSSPQIPCTVKFISTFTAIALSIATACSAMGESEIATYATLAGAIGVGFGRMAATLSAPSPAVEPITTAAAANRPDTPDSTPKKSDHELSSGSFTP